MTAQSQRIQARAEVEEEEAANSKTDWSRNSVNDISIKYWDQNPINLNGQSNDQHGRSTNDQIMYTDIENLHFLSVKRHYIYASPLGLFTCILFLLFVWQIPENHFFFFKSHICFFRSWFAEGVDIELEMRLRLICIRISGRYSSPIEMIGIATMRTSRELKLQGETDSFLSKSIDWNHDLNHRVFCIMKIWREFAKWKSRWLVFPSLYAELEIWKLLRYANILLTFRTLKQINAAIAVKMDGESEPL